MSTAVPARSRPLLKRPGAARRGLLDALAGNRLFAYASLLALQLKVMSGFARWKDLVGGDTAFYYSIASGFARRLVVNPALSPLYLAFYGTVQRFSPDPYTAVMVHRLLVVLALDVAVLAVLRALLPPGIAWLMAAWFALLPIDFDSLYEVHLFATIPTVAAAALLARLPGTRGRAAVLGILVASIALVRNELVIATALWVVFCAVREWREGGRERRAALARAYGAAMLLAALCWASLAAVSAFDWQGLRDHMRRKHTLNICQNYAFGYAQRHPGWDDAVWMGCGKVMQHVFGDPEPSFSAALRANPRGMLEHFAWNARLMPAGLQAEMFSSTGSSLNPDYVPPPHSVVANWLSVALLALLAAGGMLLWRQRRWWWETWLRERLDVWVLLGCLVATTVVVMLQQRPRPSYLYNQTVALLALTGMAVLAVQRRWLPRLDLDRLTPALALALVVLVPSYYRPGMRQPFGETGQQLRHAVDRLRPFRPLIEAKGAHLLLAGGFADEICHYVASAQPCRGHALPAERPAAGWSAWLANEGIDFAYIDEQAWAQPVAQDMLLELPANPAWRRLAPADTTQQWVLLARR